MNSRRYAQHQSAAGGLLRRAAELLAGGYIVVDGGMKDGLKFPYGLGVKGNDILNGFLRVFLRGSDRVNPLIK